MSEMHARVTRAILPAFEHIPDPSYREIIAGCWARAAMEAMRSPTEEMINSPMARCYNDGPYADKEVRRIFSSMVDAALSPHHQDSH